MKQPAEDPVSAAREGAPAVSLIICTHNPRPDYFRRVLAAVEAQTLARDRWELLVVDNASEQRVADAWDLSWHPGARHIREDELGLTPARRRGIAEARAELLVFADDDNVLDRGYLQTAVEIARSHPYLGVFGAGDLHPEFEIEPSRELIPVLPFLALRSVPRVQWSNHLDDTACFPWGAGLCTNRNAALQFGELTRRLKADEVLGRRGGELFCGEDDLFAWAAVANGQGFGLFPELRVAHLISAGRLTRSHCLRLVRAHQFSHGVLRYLLKGSPPQRLDVVGAFRLLLHGMRRGWFSLQCGIAAARGRADAADFIAAKRLTPIDGWRT
jgi:GT2 family glycosyltransferase